MPVFVSYNSEDVTAFENLIAFLKAHGLEVWSDRMGVKAGGNLRDQIRKGVDACEVAVFLATEASIRSPWCLAEVGAFWGQDKPVITYRVGVEHKHLPEYLQVDRSTDRMTEVVSAAQDHVTGATDLRQRPRPVTAEEVDQVVRRAVAPVLEAVRLLPLASASAPSSQAGVSESAEPTGGAALKYAAVGRLDVMRGGVSRGMATAFLIGAALVLCPRHVVDPGSFHELLLGYQIGAGGISAGERFALELVAADADLDFALLIAQDAQRIAAFGCLERVAPPVPDVEVSVVSHPGGGLKQVQHGVKIVSVDDRAARYSFAGVPGSSGAPVIDAQGAVVAMHRVAVPRRDAAGRVLNVSGKRWSEKQGHDQIAFETGEGVRLDAIALSLWRGGLQAVTRPGKSLVTAWVEANTPR